MYVWFQSLSFLLANYVSLLGTMFGFSAWELSSKQYNYILHNFLLCINEITLDPCFRILFCTTHYSGVRTQWRVSHLVWLLYTLPLYGKIWKVECFCILVITATFLYISRGRSIHIWIGYIEHASGITCYAQKGKNVDQPFLWEWVRACLLWEAGLRLPALTLTFVIVKVILLYKRLSPSQEQVSANC